MLLHCVIITDNTDLFATLRDSQKFIKLDLSYAYHQLELDEETQELLMVNTHWVLYQPTRLQFGVHSATGSFQWEVDERLKVIPFCKAGMDNILISGHDDASYRRKLQSIFASLDKERLKFKWSKWKFLLSEVTHLGFKINKEDTAPLPEKVAAMIVSNTQECHKVESLS